MTNLTIREIGVGRKLLLVAVLVIAIAAPLAVGIIHMVSVNAQATALDGTTAMAAAYEVVSVKPAKPACADVSIAIPPGGLTAHCITLWGLIYNAYEVRSLRDHPPGLPGWADKDRFDVDARMNDQLGAALRRLPLKEQSEQRRLMMRAFLSDRFHLRVHYESRPEPIYELVVAKAGPKVKPLPADEKSGAGAIYDGSPSRIKIEGNSMSSLAFWLSQTAGRTVVDKTGLAGNYDIELKWTPDDQQGAADAGPTLFTALQEQLGLKLHPAKGSVRTLVIDHADKPSSN